MPVRHDGPRVGERAKHMRKEGDRLTCWTWNDRVLGYKRPVQPSPTIGICLTSATDTSRFAAGLQGLLAGSGLPKSVVIWDRPHEPGRYHRAVLSFCQTSVMTIILPSTGLGWGLVV